ncbi:hypothetical protein VTO42DRAFT_8430 [Malbranchea cinnamomea]
MDRRVSIPVSLPRDSPTISYWQDPPNEIADLRSTALLPDTADVVVIGSGISGASIAYNILHRAPRTRVVMLEARQACSGATGRNGGHTKGASYVYFAHNAETLGVEEAVKIAKLEYNNIKQTHAFAREHNIPCDSNPCDTVDIIYDQQSWDDGIKAIEMMKKAMPGDPASHYKLWSSKEAEERFLCKGAVGAISYEAGSISAYKLVIGILKLALHIGLNLQTHTPVTKLRKLNADNNDDAANGGWWDVTTFRGTIRAPKVVLATNGYTAAIYPKLQGTIVPLRGQITAHRPGSNMPKSGLTTTYSFVYGKGFDYMIPRPQGSKWAGDIVIGGGLTKGAEEGLYQYGNTDDTTVEPDISKYLVSATENFFGKENWGQDHPDGRIRREWSGIMGYSADLHPLVGEMPGEKGLYISASFQGHGMVLAFLCAQALISILFGDDEQTLHSWFPRAYLVSEERIQKKMDRKLSDPKPKPQFPTSRL